MTPSVGEILDGLWRYEARHPEWTDGEDWDPVVAWWAVRTSSGVLLVDPLIAEWAEPDRLVGAGGCAGVVRTVHWHERTVAEAADRYGADVISRAPGQAVERSEIADGITPHTVERADELALWLPAQRALLFGDAMLRQPDGRLTVCPDSWTQPVGGPERLRAVLGELARLPAEHVLVSHGPVVLGDAATALPAALAR